MYCHPVHFVFPWASPLASRLLVERTNTLVPYVILCVTALISSKRAVFASTITILDYVFDITTLITVSDHSKRAGFASTASPLLEVK
jgi:hypothetical protein